MDAEVIAMDIAECTLDGKKYYATQFESLPPDEQRQKRQMLICTACKAKAFFRKQADSGQAACFGARPHNPNCDLGTPETQRVSVLGGEEDALFNPGQVIKIDLKFGASVQNYDVADNPDDATSSGRGLYKGTGPRPPSKMVRRLSTILNNLIASDEFRNSDQLVEFEDKHPKMVKDFFVQFDEITDQYNGVLAGYWGMLTDARNGATAVWLNTGGKNHPSIPLGTEWTEVQKRFHIDNLEQLAGAYVLVIGTLRRSGNNKKYIEFAGIELITIKPE
jgi:hypothetical protein